MNSSKTETVANLNSFLAYSFKQRDLSMNEFAVQKIIYKVKMELDDNHPLYDELPYYWYYHGPFCEPLSESYKNILPYCSNNNGKLNLKTQYLSKFNWSGGILDEFPEVKDIVEDILDKGDYIYHDLAEDIYRDYAPFDVVYPFKYIIFNATEDSTLKYDSDAYVKAFRSCQRKFPTQGSFMDFYILFTGFAGQIDILNDYSLLGECWDLLRQPIRNIWFTYAKGLRILAHDSFYDKSCDEWDILFKNSINNTINDISEVRFKTMHLMDHSVYNGCPEDTSKFIDKLVSIYLGDDF